MFASQVSILAMLIRVAVDYVSLIGTPENDFF